MITDFSTELHRHEYFTMGALHELNQMVNHLVKHRHVARDANPQLKLT